MGKKHMNREAGKLFLVKSELSTPLGPMIAVADEDYLYLLQFADMPKLERQLDALGRWKERSIVQGSNALIVQLADELERYFAGKLQRFTVPTAQRGTSFHQQTWHRLQELPYGMTSSYAKLALAAGRPNAHRAVANANATNNLVIIVPCHRIIKHDGSIGGYGGGIDRKQWLIRHEAKMLS